MKHILFTLAFLFVISPAFAGNGQVPFGDQVTNVVNYNRAAPMLATGGKLREGGMGELKYHGFEVIIDIRTPEEGTAAEAADAKRAGIAYHNIPVGKAGANAETVAEFTALMEKYAGKPVLLHCGSGNRVGGLLTLYHISKGVPRDLAIQLGYTAGMKDSTKAKILPEVVAE